MTSKFALVIANTEYQDASFAKLTAPGKDAEEFAQVLRELAVFDDVQVLLNEGEGRTRRSIARFFAERKRDDLLLLYFSGHGVRNEVGQLFLAANDTEINILEASGIPAEFVTQSMNNSRSQRQLLILDCCNSGAFAHGSKSAAGVGKSMGIASAFEGSGFGRVVLTATDATQYAWEGDKIIGDTQKSVFTHFLIEGLKGEADRDSDGRIHVDELYDYAYEQVVRRTPKQTPGKWSYKQQGDIILRENLQPREVKPALLPSDLLELLSHPNSSVRRVGIQDLISILNGKHLGLARGAEEKLREIAENDDSFSFRRTASEALTARGLIVEAPSPVGILKEKQQEEFKIEKPVVKPSRSPELPKPTIEKKVAPNVNYRLLGGIAGGLLVLALCIWGGATLLNNFPIYSPETTRTSSPQQTSSGPAIIQFLFTPSSTAQVGDSINIHIKVDSNNPGATNINVGCGGVSKIETSEVEFDSNWNTNGCAPETVTIIVCSRAIDDPNWTNQTCAEREYILSPNQQSNSATPTLGIGSTMTGEDDMTLLYVPAGEFTMGMDADDAVAECEKHRSPCNRDWFLEEEPPHIVYLDAYYIDETEVTNGMYDKCVDAGVCDLPPISKSYTRDSYYGNPNFDEYPVLTSDSWWIMGITYCEWAGRRLPTEAEWEKAARGEDGLLYSWGNDFDETRANFCDKNCPVSWADKSLDDGHADTAPVGSYPENASPYGALDMAGNVSEWVMDWYSDTYYASSPALNPSGPESGEFRVLRGGSWDGQPYRVASTDREYLKTNYKFTTGFRCAIDATP